MAFELPPLPYAYDALEAAIDKQTMQLHHDKHHAAYVNNLNAALEIHADWQNKTVDEFCAHAAGADIGIGVVRRASLLRRLPETERTWLKFRRGAYTGATAANTPGMFVWVPCR